MKYIVTTLFFAFLFLSPFGQAQNLKKEWTFKDQLDGSIRTFKQGQTITVEWEGLSGSKTTKGKLADITTDTLKLNIAGHLASIDKKVIEQIRVKGNHHWTRRLLNVLLILTGFFLAGFFILYQVVYTQTRTDYQLQRGENITVWPWAFVGVGIIVLGFLSAKKPIERTDMPFGKEWTIQEKPAKTKTNKTP